ncbi:hypothetical protein HCC45_09725 [Streptococcus suis]|nr:hypothetical protein [Streptococcus suis]
MKLGAGKAEIMLDSLLPIATFKGIQEHLMVRSVYIEQNQSLLLVSLEMTSLPDYAIDHLKQELSSKFQLAKETIFIMVTHTFSAPHLRSSQALKNLSKQESRQNQQLLSAISLATISACEKSVNSLEEARLEYGKGSCDININRDIETDKGWWLGQNPRGYSNKEIRLIRAYSQKSGKCLAYLYSYDMQSSFFKEEKEKITGDLVGHISRRIEENKVKVALYLLGAAGDQAPKYEEPAEDLITSFIASLDSIETNPLASSRISYDNEIVLLPGQKIKPMKELSPNRHYLFEEDEKRACVIDFLQIGDWKLVALQPELTSQLGHKILTTLPSTSMLVTMVNGGQKYLADWESYEKRTYEAMNSYFAQGSGEILQRFIKDYWQGKEEEI